MSINKKYYFDDTGNDQDGVSWDSPLSWLWCGIMGGCGCGSSDTLQELAFEVLELFSKPHKDRDFSVYDKIEYEIIAHWLDNVGMIEHGSSIGGAWLSEEGEQVFESIKSVKEKFAL